MNSVLFWALPPLLGAFIGYITNIVAIKMLFRPLKKIRFLGIKLPFTPGILPRERHKLAESIGSMVERELMTPEVLRERLAKAEVRENVETSLSEYTDTMLKRPLTYWLEDRSDALPVTELLSDFINSDIFDSFLEEIIRNWAGEKAHESGKEDSISSWFKRRFRDIGEIFIPTARDLIKSGLVKDVKNHARGKQSFYRRTLESIAGKYPGITLGEFLSLGKAKKQQLDSLLAEKAISTLDENVEGALSSVDVRTLVNDRINSLDMIRVERIILDVMAGQLKWIHFFGAIIGAIIGFAQALFSFFTRY